MILWDVNIWVYAFRADSPVHERAYSVLTDALERRESFLFFPSVASSFLRLVTDPKIFEHPSTLAEAWSFVDFLEAHPASVFAEADAMTFGIFKHLCLVSRATGNSVPEAFLAALALRHDARLVTADSRMSRFEGVNVEALG
jgi:uncharacterized protein